MSVKSQSKFNLAIELITHGKYTEAYGLLVDMESCDEAKFQLAWLLTEGKGVERDLATAKKLYQEILRQESMNYRNPECFFYLGNIAEKEGDIKGAIDYYYRGFENNNLPSICSLGVIYAEGHPDVRDMSKAKYYLELAAERGHVFGKRKMASLMLRGHFGMRKVGVGLYLIVRSVFDAVCISITDPHDDRLR